MGNEILRLLNEENSVKILTTIDENGLPYPAVKGTLHYDEENIVYSEFLESSKTNRNMTRSLWFDKPVRILLLTADKKSFRITALPHRAIVNGKIFQRYYEAAREQFGDVDLSTVWLLKPLEAVEQSFQKRIDEESENRPYFMHLDRLAKKNEEAI
jgi:hypothetical protein